MEAYETGLGTYCILEEVVLPRTLKQSEENLGLWKLYFDGSRSRNDARAGAILISLKDEKLLFAHRLQFTCSNNVTEYEALVHGLLIAEKKKIKALQIFGDTKLVIHQVTNKCIINNKLLKDYKHKVWDLFESFDALNMQVVPHKMNREVDQMAALGLQFSHVENFVKGNT